MRITCIGDFRSAARRALPRMLFDYIDGGSYAEQTLERNVEDFKLIELRQRVLQDVSQLNLATTLFGQALSMPLILSPVGMAGLFARRGEVRAARAAASAEVPFCLSTVSICSLQEVCDATSQRPWSQLYMLKDRGIMRALLRNAAELGVPVLIFTVDLATPGARYRDSRSGFSAERPQWLKRIAAGVRHPRWSWDVFVRGRPHRFGNLSDLNVSGQNFGGIYNWVRTNFDPSATWREIEWIRSVWKGPIVLKGILDPVDARHAVELGVSGIVVSNHGGRQLDGVRSSIRALPRIAETVAGAVPILFDGGIRSGLDILKALSMGANACMIGRLWAYALASGGERAVGQLLQWIRGELSVAMALSGCRDVGCVDRALIECGPP